MHAVTNMRREILEIPSAVARFLEGAGSDIAAAASSLRARNPDVIITVARGSSDHAATFFKYVCELQLGIPVASVGPSISSVYGARIRLDRAACVSISQSGRSPDIVRMTMSASEQGASCIAITNDPASPLADPVGHTIPLLAGPELSVAATKTFVTSLVASLALVAHVHADRELIRAIDLLPELLEKAVRKDWPELRTALTQERGIYLLGRGPSLAISSEAALKFKETCGIHAESYSSAEVLHGPIEIVDEGFPVIALAVRDAAESAIIEVCDRLAHNGAMVFATSSQVRQARRLGFVPTPHPFTDPITVIASYYAFVEKLATALGRSPDAPRNLTKVTETV